MPRARFNVISPDYAPHYFVATDLSVAREAQPDLQALLRAPATLVATALSYRVYRFNPR